MQFVKFTSVVVLTLFVSGCGEGGGLRGFFGGDGPETGLPYRASLSRAEEPRSFTVSVTASEATVNEVRESARMPATRHCLETYGGSDVNWLTDPASGDWAFARNGDFMVFSGRCTVR
ncbi:MAG: hypothetical protein F4X97_11330 [Boseongicola sp. SB0662_bin_57]|nr:hypothetical protein [Boseongicola sp. SB0662_bin_57]